MDNRVAKTSSTIPFFPSSGSVSLKVETRPSQPLRRQDKKIEDAVYQYIRAVRILGVDKVNTSAIAEALNLSHASVTRAVKGLSAKGVRPIGR